MTTVDFIGEDILGEHYVRRLPKTYKKGSKGLLRCIKAGDACFVTDEGVKYFVDRGGYVCAPDEEGKYPTPPVGRVFEMFGVATPTKGPKRKRKKK